MAVTQHRQLANWESRYRIFLSLFPKEFKKKYGPLSSQVFSDILQDTLKSEPHRINIVIYQIFAETLVGLVTERLDAFKKIMMGRRTLYMKQSLLSRTTGGGRPLLPMWGLALIAIVLLGAVSWTSGFWGYEGPIQYMSRIVNSGIAYEKVAQSQNYGQQDVAAKFVNDYVKAKYYGSKKTAVGYQSIYADKSTASSTNGVRITANLADNIKHQYSAINPGFDPVVCGDTAPSSVHFEDGGGAGLGYSTVTALFSYANEGVPNRVTYTLRLDQSKSIEGQWKVNQVVCTSVGEEAHPPFHLSNDSSASTRFFHRNDMTFTSLAP